MSTIFIVIEISEVSNCNINSSLYDIYMYNSIFIYIHLSLQLLKIFSKLPIVTALVT